jgi:hypothetical protein
MCSTCSRNTATISCVLCGTCSPFEHKDSVFCSSECYERHWSCSHHCYSETSTSPHASWCGFIMQDSMFMNARVSRCPVPRRSFSAEYFDLRARRGYTHIGATVALRYQPHQPSCPGNRILSSMRFSRLRDAVSRMRCVHADGVRGLSVLSVQAFAVQLALIRWLVVSDLYKLCTAVHGGPDAIADT